jgi:hypothetical protein
VEEWDTDCGTLAVLDTPRSRAHRFTQRGPGGPCSVPVVRALAQVASPDNEGGREKLATTRFRFRVKASVAPRNTTGLTLVLRPGFRFRVRAPFAGCAQHGAVACETGRRSADPPLIADISIPLRERQLSKQRTPKCWSLGDQPIGKSDGNREANASAGVLDELLAIGAAGDVDGQDGLPVALGVELEFGDVRLDRREVFGQQGVREMAGLNLSLGVER